MTENIVNARAFGAKGDGTTNDRPAIQSALDTGRDVLLPDGAYRIHGELVMSNLAQTLRGSGIGRTTIGQTEENANGIRFASVSQPDPPGSPSGGCILHQRVCDLTLTRFDGFSGIGIACGTQDQWHGDWAKFDRIKINGYATGLSIRSVGQVRLGDALIVYCGTGCFIGGSNPHSHTISGLSVANCSEVGLDYRGEGCHLILGDFVANPVHVRVQGQGTFFGGNFEQHGQRVYHVVAGIAAVHGHRILVGNNTAMEPFLVDDYAALWVQDCYAYGLTPETCLVRANGSGASVRGTLASVSGDMGSGDRGRMVRRHDTGALFRIGQFDTRDENNLPSPNQNLSGQILQTLNATGVTGLRICALDNNQWVWHPL